MNRNKLYLLLGCATAAGYAYLAWAFIKHSEDSELTPCLIKNATGIPCPSCGSTRAVMALAGGDISGAALINPLGFIIAAVMAVLPFWLLYDLALKKDTLYTAYLKTEQKLRYRWVAITLITLVIVNWIWNINKGL